MALQFKRTRLDAAQQRTFPNSKEEVIFRNDVSNKNLLQNPFRTSGIPVGPVGVQNRPVNPMVDDRGAMYGGSVSVLRKGVSNSNLLHNPYRFKTDPIDDPRTLTRQVINDINSGKAPQYIRENKGIDEIAFMIVKALPDNGVKLATLSMLKSYITGMRLQSVLDQGGQNVTKAFDVLNQLVVTSKSLYRTGMLGIKLPALLLQYSENIAKIFGDVVLQPVSPVLMFSAIQDLASVSSILTKLFRAQNSVSTPTNVSIDEWAKAEAAKIQALRQQQEQQTPPPPTPQVDATGDNHPTGTEGVRDPNNIKQEGKGKMSKKKKIPKTGGGLSVNWGIANPSNTQLTPNEQPTSPINEPSLIQNGPVPVNTMPPDPNASKGEKTFDKIAHYAENAAIILGLAGVVVSGVVGGKAMYDNYKKVGLLEADNARLERERQDQIGREVKRDERESEIYGFEKEKLRDEKREKDIRDSERELFNQNRMILWSQLTQENKNFVEPYLKGAKMGFSSLSEHGLDVADIDYIMSGLSNLGKVHRLLEKVLELQNRPQEPRPPYQGAFIDDPPSPRPPPSPPPSPPPKIKPPLPPKLPPPPEDVEILSAKKAKMEDFSSKRMDELGKLSIDELEAQLLKHNSYKKTIYPNKIEYLERLIAAKREAEQVLAIAAEAEKSSKKKKKKKLPKATSEEKEEEKSGLGRKRKLIKSYKSTIKKSKNLDAQILALLRA